MLFRRCIETTAQLAIISFLANLWFRYDLALHSPYSTNG
jgi:hypothetical protein